MILNAVGTVLSVLRYIEVRMVGVVIIGFTIGIVIIVVIVIVVISVGDELA